MKRRASDGNPLSLFSFQDVITSITGIMILVVLLLVLEVISHKALVEPGQAPSGQHAREMEHEILKMEKDRRDLLARFQAGRESLVHQTDPDAVRRSLSQATALEQRLEAEVEQARLRAEQARQRLDETKEGIARLERSVDEKRGRLTDIRAMTDRLNREPRVNFVVAGETDKTPVIVQCSGTGIRVKVMSDTPLVKAFESVGSQALGELEEWVLAQNARNYAFVVLVKPSAASYAMGVVKMLAEKGFDVGYEPLEESKNAVF